MSTNRKNTASEKKDAVVATSSSRTAPSNARFLGACSSIGFLPLLEPPLAEESKSAENNICDRVSSVKNCPRVFPQPQEESPKQESHEKDDVFDANGGLKNCPGAFPVDDPEGSDETTKAEDQIQRKELDRYKKKKKE